MRPFPTLITAASVLALSVTTGCARIEELRTSDFAKQDAAAISAAAHGAMAEVTSMRITGTLFNNQKLRFVDLQVSQDACTGLLRQNRGEVDIRQNSEGTWYRTDQVGLRNALAGIKATEPKVANKWFAGQPFQMCSLKRWIKRHEVGENNTDRLGRNLTVGDEVEIDGLKAVQLITEVGAVDTQPTTYVSSEAPHYVVRIEGSNGRVTTDMMQTNFNEEFTVDTPK